MKGSLTVEAAFIMPLCFLIIMLVCCLGIFQYNQAVLKITGYECILRTMEERLQEEAVLKENLIRRAKECGEARVLGAKNLKVSVKMNAAKIVLTYSCEQSVLKKPIEVTINYERIYPELSLRLTRNTAGEYNDRIVEERFE